jgi:hypothetical protein
VAGSVGDDGWVWGRRPAWQVVVAASGCLLLVLAVAVVTAALNPSEGVSLADAMASCLRRWPPPAQRPSRRPMPWSPCGACRPARLVTAAPGRPPLPWQRDDLHGFAHASVVAARAEL